MSTTATLTKIPADAAAAIAARKAAPTYNKSAEPLRRWRGHYLMTATLAKTIPAIGHLGSEHEAPAEEAVARAKFFWGASDTLYITEFDGIDRVYGCWTNGRGDIEWGYNSISELAATRGQFGAAVQRDCWFSPRTVAECLAKNA